MVAVLPAASAICFALLPAFGGSLPPPPDVAALSSMPSLAAIEDGVVQMQLVTFADKLLPGVRVVRGLPHPALLAAPERGWRAAWDGINTAANNIEFVTFHGPQAGTVRVVRGRAPTQLPDGLAAVVHHPIDAAGDADRVETVRFANPGLAPVTVVRGQPDPLDLALFDPARASDLDLVAFVVDGLESGHGRNPAMWRPEPSGPQGPMQVSEAAALDVGGGDRFDLRENRILGRAYLAHLYRRYGDWPDAIAAYNWGPGNMDSWIVAGRPSNRLPIEVGDYVTRALRDALLAGESADTILR